MNVDQYERELILAGAAPRLARMIAQRFAYIHKQILGEMSVRNQLDTKVQGIEERVDDLEAAQMEKEDES